MEQLNITANSKEAIYKELLPQLELMITEDYHFISNLANVSAALKTAFDFHWVGFYIVDENQLYLGPFQGPIACSMIPFARGVCGTAWKEKRTIIVPDVDKFPGHIACSSLSRSEIVVPLIKNDEVIAILDIDSSELNSFDETDSYYLNLLCARICKLRK